MNWEIPIIRLLFRWLINPVDYVLDPNYGDRFTANESDILTVTKNPDVKIAA
ncbi:MAG: hypothetical protein HY537_11845 [Deltaproteobacteria bacterium]|nr:hypothetical protein [Deltaproteobacteria bacterium]